MQSEAATQRKRLLAVPEVAELLGCGRSLVYRLIADGELPILKLGSLTRVPSEAVDEFIDRNISGAQGGIS